MSELEQTPPSETPVEPAPAAPERPAVNQMTTVLPQAVDTPAPNPAAVAATNEKLNTRMNAKFAYRSVTYVVAKLLEIADVPAGTITGDERLVSMISFEDEPLRFCLERLRHMVSGTLEVNDQGAVDFAAGA